MFHRVWHLFHCPFHRFIAPPRPACIRSPSLFVCNWKNTKVKVFELAPPATQTELLGDFNSEDMKGVSIMNVEDMVKVAVKGMQADRFEIRPGQANQLKMMSRVAPGFILKQMSRSVDRMLGTHN